MCRQTLDNITEVSSIVAGQEVTRTKISPEALKRRADRYLLLEGLQKRTTKHRLHRCGLDRISNSAQPILKWDEETGSSYLSLVQRCGYVQFCPVCGAKIGNQRASEISQAVEKALDLGHGIYMITFTAHHLQEHTLRELRTLIKGGFKAVISGRQWTEDRADFGVLGQIRTEEATWGLSGWHPHLHVLVFTDKPLDDPHQLHARLFSRWSNHIVKRGHKAPSPEANRIDTITEQRGVGRYLSKVAVTVGHEMTRSDLKKGKGKRLSHWEVGWGAVATNDPLYWSKWFEWEAEMGGVQLCRWSNGLKSYFGINERTDQERLDQEERFTHARTISNQEWDLLKQDKQLVPMMLKTASTHGSHGVDTFFDWLVEVGRNSYAPSQG